jgi:hypothetical protein
MRSRAELVTAMMASARHMFGDNLRGLTLDEALQAAGGHRSVLGLAKHAAAWGHVY